jgi:TRAP-type C4-dicarboxylate transport system permease small subunit
MAKQYKKLQNKLHPKAVKNEEPKYKPGKDYLLLIMIGITFILTLVGWEQFDNTNRAMYFLLTLSLTLTYLYRHGNFPEKVKAYVNAASLGSIGLAVALFLLNLYYQFFG